MKVSSDPRGSIWRRWDPHIHTPDTALNNQFSAHDWDAYLTRIEESEPPVEAIGVTDYLSLENYEKVINYKANGRIPEVGLIFPNIEMRLLAATSRERAVNVHLLVSPEDPEHVIEARRFLRTLKFEYLGEVYSCEDDDLIKLGHAIGDSSTSEIAARRQGVLQFKVALNNLKKSLKESLWAQRNILIGVAVGQTDGTSGLRDKRDSFKALRQDIERSAHVIFSSSPNDRDFWLGLGSLNDKELTATYGGRKACLHGSDAHKLEDVVNPDLERFTWIKGDTSFESLRQACLEPQERVIVSTAPPVGAPRHRVIEKVSLVDASWVRNDEVPLSSGLVAIIGARGSGKTALVDMIAAGAGAVCTDADDATFLQRAGSLLTGDVILEWGDGSKSSTPLPPASATTTSGRAQYLSQKFVERLCSTEGLSDELLFEMERVLFDAQPQENKHGASSLREMLHSRASRDRNVRAHAQESIESLSRRIVTEQMALHALESLEAERSEIYSLLKSDRESRAELLEEQESSPCQVARIDQQGLIRPPGSG